MILFIRVLFDEELKGIIDGSIFHKYNIRNFVDAYVLKRGGKEFTVYILAEGRLVNLAAAEGHPASVMDMSFANQSLAAEHLVREGGTLSKAVHRLPPEIDRDVATLKLASMGIEIDQLTREQQHYLASWDVGT